MNELSGEEKIQRKEAERRGRKGKGNSSSFHFQ
jgi:hypothetical protein